jgi:hypothetical protein
MNQDETPVPRALDLLLAYAEMAKLEQNVMADFALQRDLKAVVESLIHRLNGPATYPNKAFNSQPEALARCILLEEQHPDAYAQLVRGICHSEAEWFLQTYEGLSRLDTLVRGLGDDHDYIYSPTTATIAVGDATGESYYLTPVRFLSLVKASFPTPAA